MKIGDIIRFVRAVRRIRKVASRFAKHGFYQIITNVGLSKFFIFKKYLKATYPVDDYQNVPPEIAFDADFRYSTLNHSGIFLISPAICPFTASILPPSSS